MNMRSYNNMMRDFINWTDAMNRVLQQKDESYDYERNGGSTGTGSVEASANRQQSQLARLPIDVWADENAFHIAAYLPGINPDDVEITMEGEELTIRGQLPQPAANVSFIRRELYHGTFERRLSFNVPVSVDEIEANFSNGLLTLHVPKAEAIRPKQIKIQTS